MAARMTRWLLLGCILLLAACGGEENVLANTEWRLIALGDADAPAAALGDPTAKFTTATDLSGSTGRNSYGASYSVRDSELRFDGLEWQERGCPTQALFNQEQRLQGALATVERFEIAGERLTLYSEGGQVLVFERSGKAGAAAQSRDSRTIAQVAPPRIDSAPSATRAIAAGSINPRPVSCDPQKQANDRKHHHHDHE